MQGHEGPEHGELALAGVHEFLQEGSAVQGVLEPDRIVIGEFDKRSGDMLEEIYRDFYWGKMPPLIRTNLPTAELIKYANNAFLATKISFINQIANICQKIPRHRRNNHSQSHRHRQTDQPPILVTEWDEFKKLKPEDFTQNMKQPILIDGRRIYDSEEFSQKLKFAAIGLGK